MSLMHDIITTIGDAARLSSDMVKLKLEREAGTVKHALVQVVSFSAALFISTIIFLVGAAFLIFGGYLLLKMVVSPAAAALIMGGGLVLISGIILLMSKASVKK
ncbi:hypothetical protein STSP2_00849 [Anaerohalosphaera lusitana]|uniref:Phage holin family protein n=1 Tax=Anaerohalosphaera lusitana TaxID=1936003 RepID=A0A1U9NIF8_9BACT|nr:hypothetical protein [Anaerohalosphaera lusitana]AQT67701.1 hypothetical protein STSP2_00849 [Anaerohalosphaera lusitana]